MGALASSQYPLCTIILAAVDRISGAFQKHLDILYPLVLSFTIFSYFISSQENKMKMQRKPQWTSSRLDSLLQELRGNKLDETTKEKPWAVNASVQEITTVGFCALKTDSRKVHIHFFPPSLMEMRACEIKQLIVETESRRYARQKEKKLNRNTKHFFSTALKIQMEAPLQKTSF